ncbi:hypothetical protein AMTRI_Chr09g36860 [Amborella trichopoda]
MMREFTGGTDLVRPGVTRFATSFLSLGSLNKQKDKLRTMFVSDTWMGSKWSLEAKGKKVYDIFMSTRFSSGFSFCFHMFGPLGISQSYFFTYPEIERRDSIMVAFNENVRLHPDSNVQNKVSMELDLYRYSMGTLGTDIAVRQRTKIYPSSWWANHAQAGPNLQKMAQQILNLTCTSSSCEHKFSTFEMMRLNDLIFIQYNQRLKKRHLDRFQIEDPILVKDLDPTSEWLVEPNAEDEPVYKRDLDMDPTGRGGWFGIEPCESY